MTPDASGDVQGVRVYAAGGAIGYGDPPGRGATGDDHMRQVMHPMDDKAQAARREAVIRELPALSASEELRIACAVLRALGLSMIGDANVRGVPVWLDTNDSGAFYVGDPIDDSAPHVVHALSDEAQAKRRDAVADALMWDYDEADKVLRLLGMLT